jgi:hypothetical protein
METKKTETIADQSAQEQPKKGTAKKKWQKPQLEDVSGKVMAQPYIRFT